MLELPKLKLLVGKDELYNYQVSHPAQDEFIKVLLRSYGGMFDHYVSVRIDDIATRINGNRRDVSKQVGVLQKDGIADFVKGSTSNSITYLQARPTTLSFDKKKLMELKDKEEYRQNYILDYSTNYSECREKFMLKYFNEKGTEDCGKCDICRLVAKNKLKKGEFSSTIERIKKNTQQKGMEIDAILSLFSALEEKKVLSVIKWLLDNEYLHQANNKFTWN
jgi:ATP-dependent DNA helicase RecQ